MRTSNNRAVKPSSRLATMGVLLLVCSLVVTIGQSDWVLAERIRLQDGTEFSAEILGRDADHVAIGVPRSSVATVDGQPLPPPVAAGYAAPMFSAVDLKGVTHSLADAKGQVTLLKFWATWCPHCRHDIELMKRLFTTYGDKGLRLLTVSIDDNRDILKTFVEREQLPYPVIFANDQAKDLPDRYEMRGVPAYYLIDAKGIVAKAVSGSVTESNTDLEGAITSLLAPSQAAAQSPVGPSAAVSNPPK